MRVGFIAGVLFLTCTVNAQWTKTNGPEGISIETLYEYNNILFGGTNAKGVFKSMDDDQTWVSSNTALTSNFWVLSLCSDDSYLYMGLLGEGVYRSADNGVTWQAANSGIQNYAVSSLLSAGGYLFAGTIGNGIYRSSDHGTTWTNINQGLFTYDYIHSMVCQNDRLMIEADNYLYFSYDFGNTWDVDQGITAFYVITRFFHHGDTLLASAFQSLFRSTDGGVNWDGPVYMGNNLIGFDNIGDTIYAGHKYGVYRSTDWGLTWTLIPSTGLRWGERGDNDFRISGTRMVIGCDEIGIYSSNDKGQNWYQCNLNQFALGSAIDDALMYYNGTVYSGTHSNGVYKTTDHGNNWTKIGTPNNQDTLSNSIIFTMLHPDPNVILAGCCGKGLFRSADNGSTWTRITSGLPTEVGMDFTCIKTLATCGPNILAATTKGVYYSTDLGLNWLPTNITGSWVLETGGLAIRGNIACLGVSGFPSIPYTGIWRSTDYGINWTMAEGILDISFMGAGGNTNMYAGSLFTSWVSHDNGISWSSISGTGGMFTVLAWDNYAIIGNNYGILFSSDNGNTWQLRNEGLDPYPNHAVQGLTKDNLYIYAGTNRNAVWRRPITDFIGGVLPVRIIEFTVGYNAGIAAVKWKTTSETNISRYEVQRSFNGVDFTTLGTVTANGSSTNIAQYSFDDRSPQQGLNFYRLKIIGTDGKEEFSKIISIKVGGNDHSITIHPNPVKNNTMVIQLNNLPGSTYRIEIFNSVGQSVYRNSIVHSGGSLTQTFNLPTSIPRGYYQVIISNEEMKWDQIIMIQ